MTKQKTKDPLSSKDPKTGKDFDSQINARTRIIEILTRVETRQSYTDRLLEKELNSFNDPDKRLITETVNGVLRWQYRLDWYLKQLYVGEYNNLIPDVKNNLRSSAYQLMFLDRIPPYAVLNEAVEISKKRFNQKTANLVNAILRNYLRQEKKLQYAELNLEFMERMSVTYSHPEWLIQRWIEQWGIDETVALCKSNNSRPLLTVRVNHLKSDIPGLVNQLTENDIGFQDNGELPGFYRIENFSDFRKLGLIQSGAVSVQDISTGIPVHLLDPQPGERVLDMCAAPGGKCGYIAEKMNNTGRIVALEKHEARAAVMRENLSRLGVTNVDTKVVNALKFEDSEGFDRILLDAPCSGFGVLNKRVDLRWKRTIEDIKEMKELQIKLLAKASELLKPNGVLVYSTCTIDPDENERVVEQFLANHSQFTATPVSDFPAEIFVWDNYTLRTFPHRHNIDGSYAVRLQKKNS
ncbi:MAG: 16S rRNA (cytosine(967)-C(5))-methyltransferase RsmB [Calditrichia bacterium]